MEKHRCSEGMHDGETLYRLGFMEDSPGNAVQAEEEF